MFVWISWKITKKFFFNCIIVLRFDKTKVAKEEFYGGKKKTNRNLGC